jgi:ribonuclease E
LRAIEEEGLRRRSTEISVAVAGTVALYILNSKRIELARIEQRYGMRVVILADDTLIVPDLRIERLRARGVGDEMVPAITSEKIYVDAERQAAGRAADDDDEDEVEEAAEETERPVASEPAPRAGEAGGDDARGDRRNGRRGRRGRRRPGDRPAEGGVPAIEVPPTVVAIPVASDEGGDEDEGDEGEAGTAETNPATAEGGDGQPRKRRRGKRGGRRRGRGRFEPGTGEAAVEADGVDGADGTAADGGDDADLEPLAADELATDELATDEGELPVAVPVRDTVTVTIPVAALDDVVDFDWGLDAGERPAIAEITAEIVVDAEGTAVVTEAVIASTEGDFIAISLGDGDDVTSEPASAVVEAPPEDAGPRKRTRRRSGAGSEEGGDSEAAARRTRRRVKIVTAGESSPPVEISVEVVAEAVAEIMPEPAVDEPVVALESDAPASVPEESIADEEPGGFPTERLEAVPPAAPVIVIDAPLPAPTRDSVDAGDVPVEPRPARRGWWNRGG